MTSITVPEPVMSLAVAPKNRESSGAFSKALNRFTKEDPTFKVGLDGESGQTIISGMGELHLDIYVERMKREYKVCAFNLRLKLHTNWKELPTAGYRKMLMLSTLRSHISFDYTCATYLCLKSSCDVNPGKGRQYPKTSEGCCIQVIAHNQLGYTFVTLVNS